MSPATTSSSTTSTIIITAADPSFIPIPHHTNLAPNSGLRRHVLNETFREAQINPSIVVIIIILTIIFFLSGCLHLLIRCLVMRHHHPRRDSSAIVSITALQGQLQQLFHLHDAGVDQSFIDTLPVFFYDSVQKGLKEGADCAVCLCEFEAEDRLRLLPKCSHAFHMDCIDTWLLSHSTCPLCRRGLLPEQYHEFSSNSSTNSGGAFMSAHHGSLSFPLPLPLPLPLTFPLPDSSSRSYASAEAAETGGGAMGRAASSGRFTPCYYYGSSARSSSSSSSVDHTAAARSSSVDSRPECVQGKPEKEKEKEKAVPPPPPQPPRDAAASGRSEYAGRLLPVQLGRLRAVQPAAGPGAGAGVALDTGTSSSIHSGNRRSYSVGSYEYVLDPSSLEVLIAATPCHKKTRPRPPGSSTPRRRPAPVLPGHRITLSECTPEDALEEYPDMLTPFHPHDTLPMPPTSLPPHNPLYKGYAHITLDMSPMVDDDHHHHCNRWNSRMAGPRDARLKPHDPLPLALYYCTGDHRHTQTSRRAFSFRHPLNAEAAKLKMSTSRRSHSDLVDPFHDGISWNIDEEASENESHKSFSGAQLVAPSAELSHTLPGSRTGSGLGSGVAAAPYSLAKKTLSWLVGGKH